MKHRRKLKSYWKSIAIACLLIIIISGVIFYISLRKSNNPVALVNGVPISKLDFQKKLQEASVLGVKKRASDFPQLVLNEMINSELFAQEAMKQFHQLPRYKAIRALIRKEIENNAKIDANSTLLERKKRELELYNEYIVDLRARSIIKTF